MKKKRIPKVIALAAVVCMGLTGCIDNYCNHPYHTSQIWLENGTLEPLYYTYSNNTYLTPDLKVYKMPMVLATILDFEQFSPMQVMTHPSYTENWNHHTGEDDYYRYLLLLRYDNTVVACYDIKQATLAQASYPWFTPEADSTETIYNWSNCANPEVTYKYIYFITDSIL